MVKNFINAVQFLTIVPVRKNHETEEGSLARSMMYFPLIGFLIGFLLVYADKAMTLIALPQTIANVLLVALSVLVTRALHIDGLADTLDGLMGGHDHSSRLSIMKDSRLGTAGALGIFFTVFVKYVCLNNLFESEKVAALLTAPMLARWSQTFMAFKANYGREEGMGRAFVGHLRVSGLAAASAVAIGLSAFVIVRLDTRSVLLIFSLLCGVVLLTFMGRRYLVRKLGGVTGDAIGAISELNEVLVFLLFILFSSGS
ncbi:MAG TPA: adenosylcobinamide-GDP ribazoletransferase [Nitrospirota bacterium]|nr:adenosylcobinamide-GDP ribazoletransferase [Nitrospirota bacterium]